MFTKEFQAYYSTSVQDARHKRRWGKYIHSINTAMIKSLVTPGTRVLAIGPWVGSFIAHLEPSSGLVIDPYAVVANESTSPEVRLTTDYPALEELGETFDYIILSFAIGQMEDILDSLQRLRRFCHPKTRLIITYYRRIWQPAIRLAEILGLKTKGPDMNWVPPQEIENLMFLADFQIIKDFLFCLMPLRFPLLSKAINKYIANMPFINKLCLLSIVVGRPMNLNGEDEMQEPLPKVSVVVPAKNEEGHIPEIVERMPDFPGGLELIFVEGGSSDDTRGAIERVIQKNPDKDIRLLIQDGNGKKDAVVKGFSAATGDILAILDADITVPPESLPRFVDVLVNGKAEFVNGSRMVYPMRGKAMQFVNFLANMVFGWLFLFLMDQKVRDTLCGTKVLRREDYQRIRENQNYFGDFDPFGDFDLLFGATHLNLKIVDLPIRYSERVYGNTNINRWSDGLTLLKMAILGFFKLKCNWFSQ